MSTNGGGKSFDIYPAEASDVGAMSLIMGAAAR